MRVCVQRVRQASVTVQRELVGEIGRGMLVLVGIGQQDGEKQVQQMVEKLVGLRIFEDDEGKMNRSLSEVHGEMLVVSQFTLLGDCRKGRRPSFTSAAPPELAERLYELFVEQVAGQGVRVATGQFAAQMDVALVNDGPVTLVLLGPGAAADESAPFSGANDGPPLSPGEDFLSNAPSGLSFPTDLAGGAAVISIEPSPDDGASPFTLKPLVGDIPADAADHDVRTHLRGKIHQQRIETGLPHCEIGFEIVRKVGHFAQLYFGYPAGGIGLVEFGDFPQNTAG